MTLKAGYFVLVPPLKGIGPPAWSTVAETGLGRACGSGSVLVRFFLGPGETEGGGYVPAGPGLTAFSAGGAGLGFLTFTNTAS